MNIIKKAQKSFKKKRVKATKTFLKKKKKKGKIFNQFGIYLGCKSNKATIWFIVN